MRWRRQIRTLLCAVFLLATFVTLAIRTLAPVTASDGLALSGRPNTSSKAKAPHGRPARSFEIETPWDEGSFWDYEAPAYDLSPPGAPSAGRRNVCHKAEFIRDPRYKQ